MIEGVGRIFSTQSLLDEKVAPASRRLGLAWQRLQRARIAKLELGIGFWLEMFQADRNL